MTDANAMKPGTLARMRAITAQLASATEEYLSARAEFEKAKTNFEVAREKLSAVKRIAADVMDAPQWYEWQREHPGVKYAGTSIGDAIKSALRMATIDAARAVATKSAKRFERLMVLDDLAEALEAGGFEFRTGTPKREIHAALIRLDGVQKDASGHCFEMSDAWETLERIAGKEARAAAEEADNDVPF